MKLPNGEQAEVPDRKLTAYLLDQTIRRTKAKRLFTNSLATRNKIPTH